MQSQGIWKARSQMSRIHVKENSKMIWTYAHIPMYAVIGVKLAYVRGYRGKSRVYHFYYVFRDDQGHIKRKKVVHRG